jgi:thioester reductase-like protein
MSERQSVFLTGATGFLGQYLLCDLLRGGHSVAVLVRDLPPKRAAERVDEILAGWSERLERSLPKPVVLAGELGLEHLGLPVADRRWLGRSCRVVLHSAANLSFRKTATGEPWRTNVEGTASLLACTQQVGLKQWHQVSTAFVCGLRRGTIYEEDLDWGQSFHNSYEESKFHAEQLVRSARGLQATVYRPTVIVGDSRTGYTTSFIGFYRFLELAVRLAEATGSPDGAPRHFPLRVPMSGEEPWALVPVDWVSQAIVELIAQPRCHGRTFHLTSQAPVLARLIRDVGTEEVNLQGVEFAPLQEGEPLTRVEQLFLEGIQEYAGYLAGNPHFDCANTKAALPNLPPPVMDAPLLRRLIRFALGQRWGRRIAPRPSHRSSSEESGRVEYIEKTFPRLARQSRLFRQATLTVTVALDLRGPGGGQWSCKWRQGELVSLSRGLEEQAETIYHTDTTTFDAVIAGRQTPQEAFFERRITITGNLETGLKLAVLFGQLLGEPSEPPSHRKEVMDSTVYPR